MFENVGKKLKTIAEIYFALAAICSVLCAFIFGVHEYYGDTQFTSAFWLFLFVGPIVGYFTSLCMYGFGELIQKTSEIKRLLEKIHESTTTTPEQRENEAIEKALKF